MNEPNLSDPTEASSGAGTPAPQGRKYTPEQLRKQLADLGVKDATLKPGGPTAFELPAFPNSQPRQD